MYLNGCCWNRHTRADVLPCRGIRRIRQPLAEIVSVAEIKEHLRIPVEDGSDDLYLAALISSARALAEEATFTTFTATRWQAVFPYLGASCGGYWLPYAPLLYDRDKFPLELLYLSEDGVETVVDPDLVKVDPYSVPGRFRIPGGLYVIPPADLSPDLAVEQPVKPGGCRVEIIVRWWAGCEDPRSAPPQAKAAVARMVARLWGDRGDNPEVVLQQDPAVSNMLASISFDGRAAL